MARRRRFKQTVPFIDRLAAWAKDVREEADRLPPGPERDELLHKVGRSTQLPV
jgi:hypothetical protein